MASLTPVVLESVDLVSFIQFMLDKHASPSTLVVCSTKDAFLKDLQAATAEKPETTDGQEATEGATSEEAATINTPPKTVPANPWTTPTLCLLASSRTVKLAFCPDVTRLRAYLATYAYNAKKDEEAPQGRLLAVLNPITLHRPTSAFSAQGLNRTFSLAVEAAHFSKSQLILAECSTSTSQDTSASTFEAVYEDGPAPERPPPGNPWDEEVSILNVTTKTFGAGERGWVGRTVKIRAIAGRWCAFQTLEGRED